jgi:hypothetical protein
MTPNKHWLNESKKRLNNAREMREFLTREGRFTPGHGGYDHTVRQARWMRDQYERVLRMPILAASLLPNYRTLNEDYNRKMAESEARRQLFPHPGGAQEPLTASCDCCCCDLTGQPVVEMEYDYRCVECAKEEDEDVYGGGYSDEYLRQVERSQMGLVNF